MDWDKIFSVVFNLANLEIIKFWALTYGWNCRGGGSNPQFMSTDAYFWVKMGFKFQSLGKISNISTSDPLSQFF